MTQRADALPASYKFDDYIVDSILGAGSFGVTYRAHDPLLDSWVAIKEYFPVEFAERHSDGIQVKANRQGLAQTNKSQESNGSVWWYHHIDRILAHGAEQARAITAPILKRTYEIIGMVGA